MIIDGRAIAADILAAARKRVAAFGREIVVRAVVVGPTPATESYLRVKSARAEDAGMRMDVVRLADDSTADDVRAAVLAPGADAVIIQLPLPSSISPLDAKRLLDTIPTPKDADVLSNTAYESFVQGKADALLPPVVGAVKEVLDRTETELQGKLAVVIGQGRLVGQPAAVWLARQGAAVRVIIREDTLAALPDADLIVSGAGSPHLITPNLLKRGVVLIDAGTSESNGAIVGDAHPDCASVASVFTPVPGGMGPIAVACLFKNVAALIHPEQAA